MKRYCVLLVCGALLAAVTVSVGQAPTPVEPPPRPLKLPSPQAAQPKPAPATVEYSVPLTSGRTDPAPAKEKEKGIEELLAQLDSIKLQQEQLEKARTETVALVKEKLKQQKQRLQKLGVEEEPAPTPPLSTTGGQVGDSFNRGTTGSPIDPAVNSNKKP